MNTSLASSLVAVLLLSAAVPAAPPVDLANRGSVKVAIEPPGAVTAGAMWRVDGGSWHGSEFTQGQLAPGNHTVGLQRLDAWQEPAAIPVVVLGGSTTSLTVAYEPLPIHAVGAIPPFTIWQGQALRFLVASDPAGSTARSVTPAPLPRGELSFNPASGLFVYSPAAEDKDELTVSFHSTSGAILQTITIAPLSHLLPEQEILAYQRPVPDPEGKDYLFVNETASDTPEELNGASRTTRAVTISGKTVVFDSTSPKNSLHEAYDGRMDLKDMKIYAETVVIRSPLHLAQTDVTIHARELRFEDKPGSAEVGLIDTTPGHDVTIPAQLENGKPGHKAGSISLHIERYHSDPAELTRFYLRGGQGQAAGPGKNGLDGQSMVEMRVALGWDGFPDDAVYSWDPEGAARMGEMRWPGDGANALPAGKPGNGGPGGDFRATMPVLTALPLLTRRTGGGAGAKGAVVLGGAPGQPNPSRWVKSDTRYWHNFDEGGQDNDWPFDDSRWHQARRGADAPAPDADVPTGMEGSAEVLMPPHSWLHPLALRSILLHARDTYLQGSLLYTRDVLEEYVAILDFIGAFPPEHEADVAEMRQEMENLLHRIHSHLDYFGNPAGWVPMLSFEANYLAFRNEIDAAIPILYLTYWLQNAAATGQARIAAMEDASDKLREEIAELASAYNDAQALIPGLEVESANLQSQIGTLEAGLKQLEAALLARAQQEVKDRHKVPLWKQALKTISVILKVVPVAQPVLGAVGTGLDFIANIRQGTAPLDVIEQAVEVAKGFDGSQFKEKAKEFQEKLGKIDCNLEGGLDGYKKCFDSLKGIGSDLAKSLKTVQEIWKKTEAPQSEVEAELQKIKASDPVFNELVDQVRTLNAQKQVFSAQLASAMQTVTTLSGGIQKDLLAVDGLGRSISAASGKLDHAALLYLKGMEQRTRDRLLKYQYYMAKAYEYRMLLPYEGTFHLNGLFERFQAILDAGGTHVLTPEQFGDLKALYTEELQDVAARIFDEVNENAPKRESGLPYGLTIEELAALNKDGRVIINLVEKGLFGATEENHRIVDLRTQDLEVHPVGGAYGSTAILRIKFEHSGVSRLISRGKTYSFTHYRDVLEDPVNPITWKTVYNGIRGTWSENQLSAADDSLIRFLLEQAGRSAQDIILYSRPAAWADIVITREVTTSNGVDMAIDRLDLEVDYEYADTQSTQSFLRIEVPGDLAPNIFLSVQDINSRQDGRGDFLRVYPRNTLVVLTAQPIYGVWEFEKWTDRFGRDLSPPAQDPVLQVRMSDHKSLRAVYRPAIGPGTPFMRGDVNTDARVDISDAVAALDHLFKGRLLECEQGADANDDGRVDISDPTYILNFLFKGGPKPPAPFPICGTATVRGNLTCETYDACP